MAISDPQLLVALSRTPFVDSTELALILGELCATVHRTLTELLAEGIVGYLSHGTAHLPSSQRHHLTAKGFREAIALHDGRSFGMVRLAWPRDRGTHPTILWGFGFFRH